MMRFLLFLFIAAVFSAPAECRKKGYSLKYEKQSKADSEEQRMTRGSFMVASQCEDCNNGYTLDGISFSGYDKPQRSSVETFFITNRTDRRLSGVNLYIEYDTPDGRMLSRRFVKLICDIAPGETGNVQVDSWDKQKSFYYIGGEAPHRGNASPFTVKFDPVAYYLRF